MLRNLSLLLLLGCSSVKAEGAYAAKFEECYQVSGTCEEYLKCWQDNQRANHRPVTGSCKGIITTTGGSDAGADR